MTFSWASPRDAPPRSGAARRILALSGGGVRGIVEIAFLEAIERDYQRRYGPDTRLADVFDLIGGTSTGALIGAALAIGKPVSEIAEFYLVRAERFFRSGKRWRFGFTPIFDGARLEREIRRVVGDIRLDDPAIRTHLAIVLKRLDTGSAWIVSNIPTSPYWNDPPDHSFRGNRNYSLATLLRASSAAPTFFVQQVLEIGPGERGVFVDGGASPHNDPALALFMLARMNAYGLVWPTGPERMFILSVGTGRRRARHPADLLASAGPLRLARDTLLGVVGDSEQLVLTMMEWLGRSRLPAAINTELGTLDNDFAGAEPLFEHLRLDLPLEAADLAAAGLHRTETELARFDDIDDPDIIRPLYDLARDYCDRFFDPAMYLV